MAGGQLPIPGLEPQTAGRLGRFFGVFGKFFGNTVSTGAAFASGVAVAPTLEPVVQELVNEAWSHYQSKPLDYGEWAEIVAEDVDKLPPGETEAKKHGIKPSDFDELVQAVLNAPGVGELLVMWRRNAISDDQFLHGLRKARLELLWDDGLAKLKDNYLDPAVVALGIVRDTIPDPGLQVGAHDTTGSDVPQGDQYPRDPLAEFAAGGIDEARARVMVQNIGLPMPPVRAANAYFRHIINKASYYLSVAQSDSRPAWADAILEEARQILTAHDWVELRLRGWIKDADMYAGTALHGMSEEDTDRLFKVLGRPMTHHQVFLAKRRGGEYGVTPADIDADFLKSLEESNERPEWYGLEWAYRFTQPSAFVIRQYLKDGGDPAWAQKKLWFEGWEQSDIDVFIKEYAATGTTATAKPKPFTYSQIHQAWRQGVFGIGPTNDQIALSELENIGYPATRAQILLDTWKASAANTPGGG